MESDPLFRNLKENPRAACTLWHVNDHVSDDHLAKRWAQCPISARTVLAHHFCENVGASERGKRGIFEWAAQREFKPLPSGLPWVPTPLIRLAVLSLAQTDNPDGVNDDTGKSLAMIKHGLHFLSEYGGMAFVHEGEDWFK